MNIMIPEPYTDRRQLTTKRRFELPEVLDQNVIDGEEGDTTPLRLIFLDFDGVLNSSRSMLAHRALPHTVIDSGWDSTAIAIIANMCRAFQAHVVITATMRVGFDEHDLQVLRHNWCFPVLGFTPSLSGARIRGDEIKAWMDARNFDPKRIVNYAIVDDDSDMLEDQKPHLVKCTYDDGLTFEHALRIADLLAPGAFPWLREPLLVRMFARD